jgi:hypothetical protein
MCQSPHPEPQPRIIWPAGSETGEAMTQMLEEVPATPVETLTKLIAFTRRSEAGAR